MKWWLAFALVACGPRLPTPVEGSHQTDLPERVPYPPPRPRVEVVPPQPSEDALWVDGTWRYNGRTYVWSGGRWQRPPGEHAPMTTVRRQNGELLFYSGVYRALR